MSTSPGFLGTSLWYEKFNECVFSSISTLLITRIVRKENLSVVTVKRLYNERNGPDCDASAATRWPFYIQLGSISIMYTISTNQYS